MQNQYKIWESGPDEDRERALVTGVLSVEAAQDFNTTKTVCWAQVPTPGLLEVMEGILNARHLHANGFSSFSFNSIISHIAVFYKA